MTVLLYPIRTPHGMLYLAEPILVAGAGLLILRKRLRVAVSGGVIAAAGVVLLSVGDLVAGRGASDEAIHEIRAMAVLIAGLILIHGRPTKATSLVAAASVAAVMLTAFEIATGHVWNPESHVAPISGRISGPLGPGFTASLVVAGLFLAWEQRKTLLMALMGGVLLLLASRAHLFGVTCYGIARLVANRGKSSRALILLALAPLLFLARYTFVERLSPTAWTWSEFQRSRLGVWRASLTELSHSPLLNGTGSGGLSFGVPNRNTAITYTHSQYLTPLVLHGLLGLVLLGIALADFIRRAWRNGKSDVLMASLAASFFGEFIFSTSVPANFGAIAIWAVASTR